jgi:hypothetical protein
VDLFKDTDVCYNDCITGHGNVEKKDVFCTESTDNEQSLWARETANVSTWNVIAGPLATSTSPPTPLPIPPAASFRQEQARVVRGTGGGVQNDSESRAAHAQLLRRRNSSVDRVTRLRNGRPRNRRSIPG